MHYDVGRSWRRNNQNRKSGNWRYKKSTFRLLTNLDETREWGPPYITSPDGKHKLSAYFISINRNKQSMTLDLKSKKGRDIIHKLAKESDILIENFLPGMIRLF